MPVVERGKGEWWRHVFRGWHQDTHTWKVMCSLGGLPSCLHTAGLWRHLPLPHRHHFLLPPLSLPSPGGRKEGQGQVNSWMGSLGSGVGGVWILQVAGGPGWEGVLGRHFTCTAHCNIACHGQCRPGNMPSLFPIPPLHHHHQSSNPLWRLTLKRRKRKERKEEGCTACKITCIYAAKHA